MDYEGRPCVVYAEELARLQTAEQLGERAILQNGRYIYHDDALRFLCEVGSARLDFGDFPSGLCILERFCPSDPCDEIMECALEFKEIIEGRFPRYTERFQRIWSRFLANRGALERIYGRLPVSVFQADLNPGNILLDRDMRFAGVLDLNLTGRDTALNVFFRELWINFDEDSPDKRENNMYYVEENSEKALRSFLDNLLLMKNSYHFTQAEKEAAPLLYRYLRPFWWRPLHALKRDQADPEKVGQILSWIETEQSRGIDFERIMARDPCGTDRGGTADTKAVMDKRRGGASMDIIEVSHLVKEYKKIKKESGLRGAVKNLFVQKAEYVRAVDDISFSIEKGDVVGYIGPNGAGKSTTVKMLSGIMRPTSGEILIDGVSPQRDRKRVVRNLGVVFGQRSQLNWDLRLGETFELLKRIYQIEDSDYKKNLGALNEIFQIDRFIDTPVRQLSLGQRMRGDLVAAMLHSPDVLFLDEPTIGLDVEAKYSVRKFIKEVNQRNKTTIILTTHDLGDIQELCQRVIIINEGKIIEDGSLDTLVDKIAPYRHLIIDFYRPATIPHLHAELVSVNEARAVYRFRKDEITAARLIEDISHIAPIKEVGLEEAKIDDIIRTVYQQGDVSCDR